MLLNCGVGEDSFFFFNFFFIFKLYIIVLVLPNIKEKTLESPLDSKKREGESLGQQGDQTSQGNQP